MFLRIRKLAWTRGLAVGCAFALVGCELTILGGGNDGPKALPDAQTRLEEALEFLERGLYDAAKAEFEILIDPKEDESAALATKPELMAQARFGYVMANTLYQVNIWVATFGQILGLVGPLIGSGGGGSLFSPDMTPEELQRIHDDLEIAIESDMRRNGIMPAAGTGIIASPINGFLREFINFFQGNLDELDKLKQVEDFNLVMRHLPVKIGGIDIMDMGGEYDLGEAYLIDAMFRLINGILTAVFAIDLTISIPKSDVLEHLFESFGAIGSSDDVVRDVLNILAVLIHTQPRFLELGETNTMKDAGILLEDSFTNFLRSLDFMRSEEDDQSDDLIGYTPSDGPGDPELLELHIDVEQVLLPGVDTGKLSDIEIPLNPNVNNAIKNIRDAFGQVPGARISWARDIVPVLALAVVTLLRTGAFDGLIDAALDSAELDASTRSSVQSLINSDIVDANLLEGLILGFIPDVLEFDVGAYFGSPGGPRDWLPFWTPPAVTEITEEDGEPLEEPEEVKLFSSMTLLVEFECNDGDDNPFDSPRDAEGTATIFCGGNDPSDQDHFFEFADPNIYNYVDPATPATADFWDDFLDTHGDLAVNLREMGDAPASGYFQNHGAVPNSDEFGIAADGIDSPFFYMAFRDPSFGKILWIKLDNNSIPIGSDAHDRMETYMDGKFHRASNRTLNAMVHGLLADLLTTLGF